MKIKIISLNPLQCVDENGKVYLIQSQTQISNEEIEKLAKEFADNYHFGIYSEEKDKAHIRAFIAGFKANTKQYSEEDMIGFAEWCSDKEWKYYKANDEWREYNAGSGIITTKTSKELLDIYLSPFIDGKDYQVEQRGDGFYIGDTKLQEVKL